MDLFIYTDGGSRGNPGPAGFGVVVYDSNHQVLYQTAKSLGVRTNNEAEYSGLIAALNWLLTFPLTNVSLHFLSDSELLVRQIQGRYKVKSSHLKPLHAEAISLLAKINCPWSFQEISRSQNKIADLLANQAMDQLL